MAESSRAGPSGPKLAKKIATPLAGIALLAAAWYLWQHVPTIAPGGAAPEGAVPSAPTATPRQIYYGPRNSLAVLPFADRSANGGQAPLARGFAAELLDRFEAVPALQVTTRSSSFFFHDETISPRIVAERLQSAFLLIGEWRGTDGALSVTVSLYDAYRDRELWRDEYWGDLDRVLQLRDAIVRDALAELPAAQASAMAGEPTSGQALPPEPDPGAWVLLQRGRYAADPLGPIDLAAAEADFRAALEQQPGYAAAQLDLAELWLHPAWPRDADPAAVERARTAAQDVIQRPTAAPLTSDSDRARAWALLSFIRHHYDWRWVAAAEAAQHAVDLRPGDAGLLALASLARLTLGELEGARAQLQASLDRDPLNLGSRLRLGLVEEFSGRHDDALASYRRVLNLRPDYPAAHAYRARVKVLQGKADSALKEGAQESDAFWRRYAETLALFAAERTDEAQSLLRQMMEEDGTVAAFQIAELFAFGGAAEEAFAWLERARDQRDPGLSALLGNPLLASLHADPRWAALLKALDLPPDLASGLAPDWPLD